MPYTPIVIPSDLGTQMYPEIQTIITRGDSTITTDAINSAICEVKMYLSRFDLVALFGDPIANTAATVTDPFLNSLVKSIAAWHLLRLANPNTDLSLAVTWYEKTIGTLKNIQKGIAMPDGWPYKDTTGEVAPQGDRVYAATNPTRNNRF